MEPNHNSFNDSSELPQPQEVSSEQTPDSRTASAPEAQTTAPMSGPAVSPPPHTPPVSLPMGQAQQAQVPQDPAAAGTQHLIADDADLIEKEWVTKAKAIVAHTKDDPYRQNQAMTKVKADYLKKRYNKDLKVSEG